MSSFSSNPHLLTKEKLKSALKANGIPLPKTEQKKAFYVELYLQRLTSQNDDEYSSDESEGTSESSPIGAHKKLPAKPAKKIVLNKRVKGGLPYDVSALSDGDLARQLKSFGATIGPITDSTRVLYQKKLAKLLTEELEAPSSKFSPKQKKTSPPKPQRRMEHADFSDGYDDDDGSTEELDVETAERLTYNHEQQDHRDSPPPPELPSPAYKSTPRKRITTSTITTRQHRRHDNKGDHAAFNGPEQTDSVEVIAVKEPAKVAKEEASICGPHIQILLAVLVFLVFISFLVYSLMEDTPRERFKEVE